MTDDIQKCIEVLKRGGLILYPTDTIWGIGCDATNVSAVKKVYALKKRADSKAMIVVDVPEMAFELIHVAVKPLTIVYEGAFNVAPNLLGHNDSLGIRVPNEQFSHQLCAAFGKPIVSTSANVSGAPSPKMFAEISKEIVEGVDYVVRYRQDDRTPATASNIIMLGSDGTFKILR